MGKKIESLKRMYSLNLPAPRCIFIMENDDVDTKLNEYFSTFQSEFYTFRSDTENSSMSCQRKLSATKEEIISLTHKYHSQLQIILQEFIDERLETKSGNIYLKDTYLIIEGANLPHHIFTNGKLPEAHIIAPRFDYFSVSHHKLFPNTCFTLSEINRLLRIAHKIPFNNSVVEFSFFSNGKLYLWEVKKELYESLNTKK